MSQIMIGAALRALPVALLLASAGTASAQTPRDVARLLWQSGQPPFATLSVAATATPNSGLTAIDVARLTAPQGASFSTAMAPAEPHFATIAGGPADLARLAAISAPDSLQAASARRPVIIAGIAHH